MAAKKLLVADDSLTIQKVIRLALSNEGYEIQAVSDGNDAIQQISVSPPDVVLIDVSLPGKSAFEVKREINSHEDLEEIRFVLMSSAFEKVDEVQLEEVQFHGRLTKPFDPAHLRQILSEVLAQVTAKRMEKTSLLRSPNAPFAPPPPVSEMDESDSEMPPSIDWDEPLEPPELPPIPSLPVEPIKELWESDLDSTHEMETLPPPPVDSPLLSDMEISPPMIDVSEHSDEPDIKHLTESTIQSSGLGDFQWSVNEPSLKPPPGMMDQGDSTFNIRDSFPGDHNFIAVPPPPALPQTNSLPESIHTPNQPPLMNQISTLAGDGAGASTLNSEKGMPLNSPSIISEEQIEAMVKNQVQSALEKMAKKIIPDVAERLIKEEIHRILSDT